MAQPEQQLQTQLTFDDGVIEKIAGLASRNVDGVLSLEGGMLSNLTNRFRDEADPTQGVDAQVGKKQVALDMTMIVEYGKDVRQIFNQICQRVQQDVERYTGLKVIEIKVHVSDVMSKRDWQDQATGKPNTDQSTDKRQVE
ncbi:Asp23/Gls24 family envelope stress response protein [Lactiplantibacillus plantarum]|uniref:Asp23/Gls24 family envelope stress response protein n=1 Tax=Lactiplantibacillus plantarum TaxID=1590 RepID=UPI00062D1350|nr:Asp23/Gls24 family envelope stress response protein [Lactiplantibacillus plantarum]KLD41941.1 alkaline-shock protein [Lactiplantibacillus plantarum]KLD56842.1 alkaline-shock protein [Lactiplantibacillus plantarum]MCG3567204.1 Asp23/Gls24 family envelope stress response protein [Lactiplantibacillus plantarum]MCG3570216.1 Asp23/Gls24 family envelope stress response protein [Lactiplantibacillus plantarum]MEE4646033.1 Asp23/Gls24 family envelope stress response protein [Lactiplantibacillus plan